MSSRKRGAATFDHEGSFGGGPPDGTERGRGQPPKGPRL